MLAITGLVRPRKNTSVSLLDLWDASSKAVSLLDLGDASSKAVSLLDLGDASSKAAVMVRVQGKFQLRPPAAPYYPVPKVKIHSRGNI